MREFKKLYHFFIKVQIFFLSLVFVNTDIISAQGWEIVSDQQTMGRAALETSSGNFIATASNCCPGDFPDNFTIIIDPYGNITDSIPVGGFHVTETTDKGFLIPNSEFITRLDSTGNIEWVKTYNPASYQFDIIKIKLSPDSTYIGIAYSGEANTGIVVFKINNAGDTLWFRKFGNSNYSYEVARQILINTNGISVLCDHMDNDSEYYASILNLDLNGNLLCNLFINPTLSYSEDFIKTCDNYFAIIGGYNLYKVDTLCNLIWVKII